MSSQRVDTKQFNTFGHALPLLLDENTGKELVKSSRKREDDIFKIDGKQRFHGAFTGGFSAGHWNTVGSAEGWAPQEFKSSRKEKGAQKRQRPQDFMDDDDFGEFGIAHRKIQARADFGKADVFADSGVKDSDALKFTLGLGLAAATRIVQGSEANWGNKLLRKLGWKDGQGIGARKRAKQSEIHGNLRKRIGPTMPSREALVANQPISFAPKDCCPITFQAKADNKGLGFKGVAAFGSEMATNSKALSVTVEGRKMNIAGQAFGVGALEEEDADIYAQDSMMNYNFDIKTEREIQQDKRRAKIEEDNKFRARYALKAPKIEGGYNDVLEGFVRGRPVKKNKKFKMPDIPRGYTGTHEFDHDCKSAMIIQACQDIARSVDEMASKYKVAIPSYVKGGKSTQLSVEQRAHMLHEPAPNIKKEEPKAEINFQCKWKDHEKQERYDRYCINVKDGKLNPYDGLAPDDYTKWEIDKEKAEFERAATQKSAITEIMKNRFKRAQYQDKDENVSLAKSKREKMYQEKIDAVKMNFFGAMTHECYDWYPSKIVCRRFNVPEPYPGSTQLGCPWLEAENKKSQAAEETVQDIFGASDYQMGLFKSEEGTTGSSSDAPKDETKTQASSSEPQVQMSGGLASAADLLKMEEQQFSAAPAQAPVRKSLMELKRELVQKQVQREDKKKFEINPRPVPGSAESKLPATVKTIVREVDLNQQAKPMSKQPSRFSKFAEPEKADSATISAKKLRIKQRQEKVTEKLTTVAVTDKPPVDVFKSIFSDSPREDSSDSESENDSSDDESSSALTIKTKQAPASSTDAESTSAPPEPKKPSGPAPLQWSRPGSASLPKNPSKPEVKEEKKDSDDDLDAMPKFVFTSKKDRQTTKNNEKDKNSVATNLKMEVDDDGSHGPALPSGFKIENSTEFPNLEDEAQVISSDSDENCWQVSTDKKSKKKKSKKEKKKKEKKEKKEKKSKKSKR